MPFNSSNMELYDAFFITYLRKKHLLRHSKDFRISMDACNIYLTVNISLIYDIEK